MIYIQERFQVIQSPRIERNLLLDVFIFGRSFPHIYYEFYRYNGFSLSIFFPRIQVETCGMVHQNIFRWPWVCGTQKKKFFTVPFPQIFAVTREKLFNFVDKFRGQSTSSTTLIASWMSNSFEFQKRYFNFIHFFHMILCSLYDLEDVIVSIILLLLRPNPNFCPISSMELSVFIRLLSKLRNYVFMRFSVSLFHLKVKSIFLPLSNSLTQENRY